MSIIITLLIYFLILFYTRLPITALVLSHHRHDIATIRRRRNNRIIERNYYTNTSFSSNTVTHFSYNSQLVTLSLLSSSSSLIARHAFTPSNNSNYKQNSNNNNNQEDHPDVYISTFQEQQYQQQQQPRRKKDNTTTNNKTKSTIFYIDDEKSIRDAVGTYLQTRGYQVYTFSSGELALQHLQKITFSSSSISKESTTTTTTTTTDTNIPHNTLPSAIITDVRMPGGMDGIEFLSYIRNTKEWIGIPVVVLTAKGGELKERVRGYNAGADAYLAKPFDVEELVSILDGLIERYRFLNGEDYYADGMDDDDGGGGNGDDVLIQELKNDWMEVKGLILEKNGGNVGGSRNNNQSQRIQPKNDTLGNDKDIVSLTYDELQVLELLCQGYMNKEIAQILKYSVRWVEGHITTMFRKTNCSNRTELVRWAVANKYIQI